MSSKKDKVVKGRDAELTSLNEAHFIDAEKDQLIIINPFSYVGKSEKKINEAFSRTVDKKMIHESLREIGYTDDNKINKNQFAWVRRNNSFFISAKPNIEEIPAGLYDIKSSMETGLYLERRSVLLDALFMPPDPIMDEIVNDLEKFWNSREKYKEYEITYKRGMLLFGPPGSGKSSLLNLLISKVITNFKGIVINMEDIDCFISMAHNLRSLEPDKPILAIIEDLDSFLQYNSTKQFLNLLDGNLQIDNVTYVATTNYMDRLEPRIINRPSRFDSCYEIGYPNEACRKFYLESKLKESDLAGLGDGGLNKWVTDSNEFTYAHLRELICAVVVMGQPYEKVIKKLKTMGEVK